MRVVGSVQGGAGCQGSRFILVKALIQIVFVCLRSLELLSHSVAPH